MNFIQELQLPASHPFALPNPIQAETLYHIVYHFSFRLMSLSSTTAGCWKGLTQYSFNLRHYALYEKLGDLRYELASFCLYTFSVVPSYDPYFNPLQFLISLSKIVLVLGMTEKSPYFRDNGLQIGKFFFFTLVLKTLHFLFPSYSLWVGFGDVPIVFQLIILVLNIWDWPDESSLSILFFQWLIFQSNYKLPGLSLKFQPALLFHSSLMLDSSNGSLFAFWRIVELKLVIELTLFAFSPHLHCVICMYGSLRVPTYIMRSP